LSGSQTTGTVSCPDGGVAIGGGASHTGGVNWATKATYPVGSGTNPTGWTTEFVKVTTSNGGGTATLYVLCVAP
jgi:hypothetical protein